MSVDLTLLASDLGCSQDDVKAMLLDITTGLDDIFVAIEATIEDEDYDSIIELDEVVKTQIAHFNLNDMEASATALSDGASAKDKNATQVAFDSLKNNLEDIKSVI